MREYGTCDKCGFVAEDSSLHLFQLHSDRFRLRGMILYAKDAPDFDSCKSILTDALDGVNGAENYDEVKGEREILRATVALWKKQSAFESEHRERYRSRVAALEEENGRLREQLRLANIDAANAIADINLLRSVVKEQDYKPRRQAGKEERRMMDWSTCEHNKPKDTCHICHTTNRMETCIISPCPRCAKLERVLAEAEKILWVFRCHCHPSYLKIKRHEPNAICGEDEDLAAAIRWAKEGR